MLSRDIDLILQKPTPEIGVINPDGFQAMLQDFEPIKPDAISHGLDLHEMQVLEGFEQEGFQGMEQELIDSLPDALAEELELLAQYEVDLLAQQGMQGVEGTGQEQEVIELDAPACEFDPLMQRLGIGLEGFEALEQGQNVQGEPKILAPEPLAINLLKTKKEEAVLLQTVIMKHISSQTTDWLFMEKIRWGNCPSDSAGFISFRLLFGRLAPVTALLQHIIYRDFVGYVPWDNTETFSKAWATLHRAPGRISPTSHSVEVANVYVLRETGADTEEYRLLKLHVHGMPLHIRLRVMWCEKNIMMHDLDWKVKEGFFQCGLSAEVVKVFVNRLKKDIPAFAELTLREMNRYRGPDWDSRPSASCPVPALCSCRFPVKTEENVEDMLGIKVFGRLDGMEIVETAATGFVLTEEAVGAVSRPAAGVVSSPAAGTVSTPAANSVPGPAADVAPGRRGLRSAANAASGPAAAVGSRRRSLRPAANVVTRLVSSVASRLAGSADSGAASSSAAHP